MVFNYNDILINKHHKIKLAYNLDYKKGAKWHKHHYKEENYMRYRMKTWNF